MNCKVCGKENPDNVDLCISCGNILSYSTEGQVFSDTPAMEFQSFFRTAWRKFVRSPFSFLLILCFSAGVLCGWYENYVEILKLEVTLGSLKLWSMSLLPYRKLILVGFHIITMLPSTLTVVGLWMIFADARNKPDQPIYTGGLKLILVLQVVLMIVLGIFFCLLLIMSGRAFWEVLMVAGLVMAIYWLMVSMIITTRNVAQNCMPDTSYAKPLAVIEFIVGVLNLLGILSGRNPITLTDIFDCVIAFLVGTVLLKYRELMGMLLAKCVQMLRESKDTTTNVQNTDAEIYVPAWKRVQMEKENFGE